MLESFLEVLKVLEVDHAQSAFKSSLNHNSPESRSLPIFVVFIDDRRLPSFITRVGLKRRPEQGTKGCSFDCRCKDTTFSGRMQAFTLTFYVKKVISSCNTISSVDFLSELYCK